MNYKSFLSLCIVFASIFFLINCGGSDDTGTGNVSGVVSDGTRAGVEGVTVSVGDVDTITNENGEFTVVGAPVGTQLLNISGGGFTSLEIEIEVEEGDNLVNEGEPLVLSRARAIALDVDGQKMYFHSNEGLYRADLDGQNMEEITPDDGVNYKPTSLALDLENDKIYWTNIDKTIYRADLGGIERAENAENITPVDAKLNHPNGIALDIENEKMYFITNKDIYVANLDGTASEKLTPFKKVIPNGIALDLIAGQMYWTNNGNKIYRADLDGKNSEDITSKILKPKSPNGIALDLDNGKMYWTNSGNKIYRADLNGESAEDITPTGEGVVVSPNGVALDVANNYMYWCNANSTIYRAELDGQNPEDVTPARK